MKHVHPVLSATVLKASLVVEVFARKLANIISLMFNFSF